MVKITLKLFATLSVYLPDGARNNAFEVEVPEGTTVHQLLERYNVPEDMVHLVLVNGIYIPQESRDSKILQQSDALAVWPPVAGG